MTETVRLRSNLLRLAEIYRSRVPQALATMSKLMARDSGLLDRLATTDAGFTVGKYDETVQRFSNYWPMGLEWPAEISRPKPEKSATQQVQGKRSARSKVKV